MQLHSSLRVLYIYTLHSPTYVVLNVNTVNFSETVSDVTIDISNLVTDMSSVQRMQAPSITIPGEFLAERFASLGQAQSLPITTVIIRNLQNYLPAATLNMTRLVALSNSLLERMECTNLLLYSLFQVELLGHSFL